METIGSKRQPQQNFWKMQQEKTAQMIDQESYVGAKGELRWKSNKRCVPLSTFKDAARVAPAAQAEESRIETEQFLTEYRASQAGVEYTAEQLFEMRAAFGPGTEIVNVITGKKVKL